VDIENSQRDVCFSPWLSIAIQITVKNKEKKINNTTFPPYMLNVYAQPLHNSNQFILHLIGLFTLIICIEKILSSMNVGIFGARRSF